MSEDSKIRWGWLKAMYIYTIVGAGGFGVGMIIMPEMVKATFKWPANEPIALGLLAASMRLSGCCPYWACGRPSNLRLFYCCSFATSQYGSSVWSCPF
jgi:hypothetical protein